MSGYRPFELLRPILSNGRPAMPVVDRALVVPPPGPIKVGGVLSAYGIYLIREKVGRGVSRTVVAKSLGLDPKTVQKQTRDLKPKTTSYDQYMRRASLEKRAAQIEQLFVDCNRVAGLTPYARRAA